MSFLPLDHLRVEHNYTGTSWYDFTGYLASCEVNLREFDGLQTATLSFYKASMDPSQSDGTRVIKKGDRVRIRAHRWDATTWRKMGTFRVTRVSVAIDLAQPVGRQNRVTVNLHGIGVAGVIGVGASGGVAGITELSDIITGAPFVINADDTRLSTVYAWNGTANNSPSTETDPTLGTEVGTDDLGFGLDRFGLDPFGAPRLATEPRVNLAASPGMEDAGTSAGWIANAGSSAAKDTGIHWQGTKSLKFTIANENYGYFPMDGTNHGGVITPTRTLGQTYTASIYVYTDTAQSLCLMDYGTSNTAGPAVAVPAATWTRLYVTFTAGTNVFLSVRVPGRGSAVTGPLYLDGFMIETGPALLDYFDGATAPTGITAPLGTSVEVATIDTATEFDQLALTRDTNPGTIVVEDPDGRIQIYDPSLVQTGPARLTLTADNYSTIDQQFDMSHIINTILFKYVERITPGKKASRIVANNGGTTGGITVFKDLPSIAKYGPFKKTITTHKTNLAAMAAEIFAKNADPVNVPRSVTVPMIKTADLLGGYEDGHYVGQRATVVLPDGVTAYSCRVFRIQHSITPTRWVVQLFFRDQHAIQIPRDHRALSTEIGNNPDGAVLATHLEDDLDGTGKTLTNATLQTAATGNRIVMQEDASEGVIKFYPGVAGETPGVINPGVDGGTGQHQIVFQTSHDAGTHATPGKMILRSNAGSGVHATLEGINTDFQCDNLTTTGTIYSNGRIDGVNIHAAGVSRIYTDQEDGGGTTAANLGNNGQLIRAGSSLRIKDDVEPLPLDTARKVLDLEPVTYRLKAERDTEHRRTYPGFIAEQVAEVGADLWVDPDKEGRPNGVRYAEIVAALIPIIRDQQARIEELERGQE